MAGGDKFTFLAEEGGVVDGEEHRHGRFIDGDRRHGLGVLEVADGVANLEFLEADDGADVATVDAVSAHVAHAFEGMELFDLRLLEFAVAVGDGDLHTVFEGTTMNAPHGDATLIAGVVERGDEHLRRAFNLLRSRDHFDDLVEQIGDVGGRCLPVFAHPAVFGGAIDNGEVELILSGVEGEHEVEHHLVDLLGATVGFVDLVDHHDGLETYLKGFLEYETGLGHGALEGVDEQQTAVGHVEHALYLTTEVGVSRGIDDVDLNAFPVDRHIF